MVGNHRDYFAELVWILYFIGKLFEIFRHMGLIPSFGRKLEYASVDPRRKKLRRLIGVVAGILNVWKLSYFPCEHNLDLFSIMYNSIIYVIYLIDFL